MVCLRFHACCLAISQSSQPSFWAITAKCLLSCSISGSLSALRKVTEVYYNAKDPTAEIYTHDTKLKKRLLAYSAQFPELCQQTDDNEQGGLTFEIKKGRLSFRLTAPYSAERRKIYSKNAKEKGMKGSAEYSFEIKKIT